MKSFELLKLLFPFHKAFSESGHLDGKKTAKEKTVGGNPIKRAKWHLVKITCL